MSAKKTRVSSIVDSIFGTIAIFVIVFVFSRFNTTLWTSLYIATLCTFCSIFLIKVRRAYKNSDKLSVTQKTQLKECINQFLLGQSQHNLQTIHDGLSKHFDNIELHNDFVLIKNKSNTVAIFQAITHNKFTETDVCKVFARSSQHSPNKILVLTALGQTPASKMLAESLPDTVITVYNDIEVYKMLFVLNCIPPTTIKLKAQSKIARRTIINSAFAPKNTRRYIVLAIIFVIYAYFFGNSILYLSFAAIALALALVCYLKLVVKD